MSKHFAFVVFPALGHVNPTLGLVEELVKRGHRVSYATNQGLAPTVEATGAAVTTIPFEMPSIPTSHQFDPESLAQRLKSFLNNARAAFPPRPPAGIRHISQKLVRSRRLTT